MPNPQAGGPPRVDCPRLFIQCIRSYPPYLEAVSTIRNPMTGHITPLFEASPYALLEHHATKVYWGVEVQLHAFFDVGTRWR